MGISTSHTTVLRKMDEICATYDQQLLSWKSAVQDSLVPTFDYQLVGDNLDLEISPHLSTLKSKKQYWFNVMAVKHRVLGNDLFNEEPRRSISEFDAFDCFPTLKEHSDMREQFIFLVERVLVERFKVFEPLKRETTRYIRHQYSDLAGTATEQIPLGLILKNENVASEMVDIMKDLKKYVPEGHQVFFGGDQLTSERGRNAQLAMPLGSERQRLRYLICKSEDWHAEVAFLAVVFQVLYNEASVQELGTLSHLQKLINRTYVSRKVSQHVASVKEFLTIVCDAYIITTAAMSNLDVTSPKAALQLLSNPRKDLRTTVVDKHILSGYKAEQHGLDEFKDEFGKFGRKFPCRNPTCSKKFSLSKLRIRHEKKYHRQWFLTQSSSDGATEMAVGGGREESSNLDHVYEYGVAVMKLGLLFRNFTDAIHEGDASECA
eukprot:m.255200 g.255200  ORF g.255200 m.255200 type:complete len:434 (+) comp40393_c0_seq14:1813-3114(+)